VNHFSWKARINSIHPYFLTKLVEFWWRYRQGECQNLV